MLSAPTTAHRGNTPRYVLLATVGVSIVTNRAYTIIHTHWNTLSGGSRPILGANDCHRVPVVSTSIPDAYAITNTKPIAAVKEMSFTYVFIFRIYAEKLLYSITARFNVHLIYIDCHARVCYNTLMKRKTAAIVLILALLTLVAAGCVDKNASDVKTVPDIFTNYTSTAAYNTITEKLRLGDGVKVSSYDGANDVFVTENSIEVSSVTFKRYGFCSSSEVYVDPRYYSVLDIRGDHAIVVAATLENGEEINYVGLVRFRGKYGFYEFGFTYPYAPLITQLTFLSDRYLIMLGDKSVTDFGSGYSYATIYDYVSANGLMETARVKNVDNSTRFVCEDGYLAAVHADRVDFYNLNEIDAEGYLVKKYTVSFFTENIYDSSECNTEVYYLGGGWFIASSTYTSSEAFDTYEFTRTDEENNVYYVAMKSKRISMTSGKEFDSERVVMVSNKYTSQNVRGLCDAINTEDTANVQNWKSPYVLPVLPTSEIVNAGYSIVYYYYYYYNSENVRSWATSFQIYDTSGNATVATNLVLPPVFVDGYGLQNADPNFSLALSEVGYHKYSDGVRVSLLDMDDSTGYFNAFVHNGVIIAYKESITTSEIVMTVGAVRASDGKIVLPFDYDAVSPFFGNYATASITVTQAADGSIEEQAFYRVGLDGSVTSIPDCYRMCNGVYVTRNSQGKFGLCANDGAVLLGNKCEEVSTVDYCFKDGKTFYTVVATVENGCGVIYELG